MNHDDGDVGEVSVLAVTALVRCNSRFGSTKAQADESCVPLMHGCHNREEGGRDIFVMKNNYFCYAFGRKNIAAKVLYTMVRQIHCTGFE